jgi:hypothetical protein
MAPIVAGVVVLWDAIQRKALMALGPATETPVSMRRMPWNQQLYIMEMTASLGLIIGGVLICTVILSRRRS